MTADSDAKFVITAPRRQGQAMGFANHNGDVVEERAGATEYGFDEAMEAAAGLVERLGQGVYVQPLLFGQIDVDAEPIYIPAP